MCKSEVTPAVAFPRPLEFLLHRLTVVASLLSPCRTSDELLHLDHHPATTRGDPRATRSKLSTAAAKRAPLLQSQIAPATLAEAAKSEKSCDFCSTIPQTPISQLAAPRPAPPS